MCGVTGLHPSCYGTGGSEKGITEDFTRLNKVMIKGPTVPGLPGLRVLPIRGTASMKTGKILDKPGRLITWWRDVSFILET